MARLVKSNGYDRALIGGFVASEETRRRKERDRQDFRDVVSRHRGADYLERFDNRSRALDVDTLARRAIAIGRHSRSAFREDMIMDQFEIGELQHTPRYMQDFLLSDKAINYLARNLRIDGWGRNRDDYAREDEEHARHNPYYRSMNHGYGRVSEDNSDDMIFENFLGHEDDKEVPRITYDEQRSLHMSRERILEILGEGMEDPTSKANNLL